jgi:dinuclear metal center YbgI/SA1388 family protein
VPTLAQVVAALDDLYDPRTAADWDAVGLVCGDPAAPVRRVLLAVDPVEATVEEAVARGADLLLTHHPLLLRPVHGVPATTPKGRLVHRLITAGVALHVAHTNADVARPGVNDALAAVLGLRDTRPLRPEPPALDKVVTFVPHADAEQVVDALAAAGAGAIGDYSRCAWLGTGTGTFLPGPAAHPAIGSRGVVERVPETRVEMVLPRHRRAAVVGALLRAHPYEEPAYDLFELAPTDGRTGAGRVGELRDPVPFAQLVQQVAAGLPSVAGGVRGAGDPHRLIRTVAVCGGAGDAYLGDAAAAGADAYVTADLRHHPAAEHLAGGGPALVDAGHWATEWPWLPDAAARLRTALDDTVETVVSTVVTDPWTVHAAMPPAGIPASSEEPSSA